MKKLIIGIVIFYIIVGLSSLIANQNSLKVAPLQKFKVKITELKSKVFSVKVNGVKLKDAIVINNEATQYAQNITKNDESDFDKAKSIYNWISTNVVSETGNSKGNMNTQLTFDNRKGTSIDHALLFSAFCKANNIKSRIILARMWVEDKWVSHAWNEFYSEYADRWIVVNCIMGTNGVDTFDIKYYDEYNYNWIAYES